MNSDSVDNKEQLSAAQLELLKFTVKLQENHHLTTSSTPFLAAGVRSVTKQILLDLVNKLPEDEKKNGSILKMLEEYLLQSNPTDSIRSYKIVKSNLQKFCGLIPPVQVPFETSYVIDPVRETLREKQVCAQVIPLKDSLEQLLNINEVYNLIFDNPVLPDDGFFTCIKDGTWYQENEFFKKHPDALIFELYEDDVELVNPLGPNTKKHKIMNVFFTLLNLPENVRSSLKSISLVSCSKSKHVQNFGFEAPLGDFMNTLKVLYSDEGLQLNIKGKIVSVHGVLAFVSGDSLALNALGGFKESFGLTYRPCRLCLTTRTDMKVMFCEAKMHFRNPTLHEEQLKILESDHLSAKERESKSTEFGVVKRSILLNLNYFNIATGLAHDVMHNHLEGVCDVAMKAILQFLVVEQEALSIQILSGLIENFPYPSELARNKPSTIDKVHITSGQLRQSASQTNTLMIVLPIILAPYIDEKSEEKFQNFVLLAKITQILLAYKIKKSNLFFLRHLIYVHHSRFQFLYPDISITPKFHFLVHAVSMIQYYGPSRVTWCMRKEARHCWFTKKAAESNNFKNIEYTLASKFQIKRCMELGFGDPDTVVLTDRMFSPVNCSAINPEFLPHSAEIASLLGAKDDEFLSCADYLYIDNFLLEKEKTFLLSDLDDDLPEFGRSVGFFVKDKNCVLLLNVYKTQYFDFKRNCYVIQKTNLYRCVMSTELPTVQTFPTFCINSVLYVNLMYHERIEYFG